jgi:hypothetical protein
MIILDFTYILSCVIVCREIFYPYQRTGTYQYLYRREKQQGDPGLLLVGDGSERDQQPQSRIRVRTKKKTVSPVCSNFCNKDLLYI